MNTFYVYLNIFFLLIVLLWSLYKAHSSEKFLNRLSFIGIGLGTTIVIVAHVVPEYSGLFYHSYAWQRLVFNACLAFRGVVEVYCEYGSIKWKEAFTNSKAKLMHITR